ncbi:serine/threonine-protein kinase [Goodfellowiella coeruleoviolacea]|uniref:non-specific serine/threonine protein kinase n=1 Tax=Goodfellowiella coeruleoviolacea TaxID=334858 RepID=A0AAE3KF27_9PSEU|nr:serine/threonine-protein kinase [Goodfellowiella coeruleoviolacea]MCP2164465.1 Serine/threonine protein kinase [Goodfellowiella coeruleoviolacea]
MAEGEGRLIAGRYQLRQWLGGGGMGVVWRAEDQLLKREVAIKEVRSRGGGGAPDWEQVTRAKREALASARLRHPGIITVHDVVTHDGLPWIVMELLAGPPLADVLYEDGPMAEDRAARIGLAVLDALDAAHRQGILHRDVKPGNIMFDGDRVVLTDFGIAVMDDASALTGTNQLIGAPEYIAPERISGQSASPASDLWALGVTIYKMLVGRSPFQRTDTAATLAAVLAHDPEPPPNADRLWPVIKGLLARDPADRLTAEDVRAMLTEALTELPPSTADRLVRPGERLVSAEPSGLVGRAAPPPVAPSDPTDPSYELTRPAGRRGLPVVVGLAAALVVVAVVVLWLTAPLRGATNQATDQNPGQRTSGAPTTPPSMASSTTSTGASTGAELAGPPLTPYREPGYAISVPADWTRSASEQGTLSDVVWTAKPTDPRAAVLTVQVQRDGGRAGSTALAYLADRDQGESANRDNVDYQRVGLRELAPTGSGGSAAELEYTYADRTGEHRFRYQIRAVVTGSGTLYALTFSLHVRDNAQTLEAQWQAAQPVLARIRDSFQLTA